MTVRVVDTNNIFGKWLNLVEHLVWDQGVAGSNPVFPTIFVIISSGGIRRRGQEVNIVAARLSDNLKHFS